VGTTGDGGHVVDALTHRGEASPQVFDARIDAPVFDARYGPSVQGELIVEDRSIAGHPELGHGGSVHIEFEPLAGPAPLMVVDDGVGVCVATLWSAVNAPSLGMDEGVVGISGTAARIPECSFVAGKGYQCLGPTGAGAAALTPIGGGNAQLVVSGALFTSDDVGRWLELEGDAMHAGNDGKFPIVSFTNSTTIVIYDAAATAASFPALYASVAGDGPIPGGPPFLQATDSITVTFVRGGANDFTAPLLMTHTPIVGEGSFTVAGDPSAIPLDGNAVTLGCASGCSVGGTRVTIETTDADVSSLSDTEMPAALARVARVVCRGDSPTIAIPASIMALVHAAAPTRARTVVSRVTGDSLSDDHLNYLDIVVANSVVGFTSP
jgi:hypothetical protein